MAELEKLLVKIPFVRDEMEKQFAPVVAELEQAMRPYRGKIDGHTRLPQKGIAVEKILADLETMREQKSSRWAGGYVSGGVYSRNQEQVEFQNKVFALMSETNSLHTDVWPSISKFEAEIVAIAADLLGAKEAAAPGQKSPVCGSVTFGGTESILLAMKSYRDRARREGCS